MSEIQDKINQILSNPEALRQVQSLGEQLGLSKPEPPKPVMKPKSESMSDDMMKAITRFAPLMKSMGQEDETTRLLNALRPFLSAEKCQKLDQAEKMMKFIRVIPMLKENGMFF
jgi:hypothetical protein